MSDINRENIENFFTEIAPFEEAYSYVYLSFLAVPIGGLLNLIQGRVFLNWIPSQLSPSPLDSIYAVAGYFSLNELGISLRDLVEGLVRSEPISTPIGRLVLPADLSGGYSSYHQPFLPSALSDGRRMNVLTLTGIQQHGYVRQPQLDWHLRAAASPFDALSELLESYSLGPYKGDYAHIEILASPVVEADVHSTVQGKDAEPELFLAKNLDSKDCYLGYRVFFQGKVTKRGVIKGADMKWSIEEFYMKGKSDLTIPSGAAIQCFASYKNLTHHHCWIGDPNLFPNSRRTAFEESDTSLTVLRKYLHIDGVPNAPGRDLEAGVSWLFWLLGFGGIHIGATKLISDAVDVMATTQSGNIVLIECTTGQIKADTKLATLVGRAQKLRQSLDNSGNRHIQLLPVIVTTLTREEVKADLNEAVKLGVYVITKEDLVDMIESTRFPQDSDYLFSQAEDSLKSIQGELNFKE